MPDERTIAGERVLRIDADKNPEEHKIARLRVLLIDLETAWECGDLLRTLGRADYLREACLGLVNALTLRTRQPDAFGKAPHTLEQVGRVLGLSKQAVADRVRALDPFAPLAEPDEPMEAATVTLGLYAADVHRAAAKDPAYGVLVGQLGYGELTRVIRIHPDVAAAAEACETLHLEHWVRVGPTETVPQDRNTAIVARLPGFHRPDPSTARWTASGRSSSTSTRCNSCARHWPNRHRVQAAGPGGAQPDRPVRQPRWPGRRSRLPAGTAGAGAGWRGTHHAGL
ncbi:hypothetical protein OG698_00970 [Streptomyces sp. NBC_01003]|uniref:hypothetical protein n=1 Tax=Streptomyces sp. NBC_01003 TaxID=2903714 RepID=UPI003864DD8D|nr:hypothetical protein OG698_00970 [Streptomyces sp. NBC_01003]